MPLRTVMLTVRQLVGNHQNPHVPRPGSVADSEDQGSEPGPTSLGKARKRLFRLIVNAQAAGQ
jgi:hypothetical protein